LRTACAGRRGERDGAEGGMMRLELRLLCHLEMTGAGIPPPISGWC